MHDALIRFLQQQLPLSTAAKAQIKKYFQCISLPKNEHLLTQGSICNHLCFMVKGCCRYYYFKDQQEITHCKNVSPSWGKRLNPLWQSLPHLPAGSPCPLQTIGLLHQRSLQCSTSGYQPQERHPAHRPHRHRQNYTDDADALLSSQTAPGLARPPHHEIHP